MRLAVTFLSAVIAASMWTILAIIVAVRIIHKERVIVIQVERPLASKVTLTAYSADRNQTDKDPFVTATLEKPIYGYTCAVSRDLARKGWLGRIIWIEGFGVWKVNDVMHSRWKNRIDLFLPPQKAKKFTPREAWAVVIK